MQSKEKENGGRHLWQITAVRDFVWIMAAAVLLWLLYHSRHILLPIFAGLVLAYLLDPVITKVKSRWGISRLFSVLLICSLVLLAANPAGGEKTGLATRVAPWEGEPSPASSQRLEVAALPTELPGNVAVR